MLNNYYTAEGKYIEHMTITPDCVTSSEDVQKMIITNETILTCPSNKIMIDYDIATLPQNAAILYIDFNITSTGRVYPNNINTFYRLILSYEGVDNYPLTNRINCVDGFPSSKQNIVASKFDFTLDNQPPIKTLNKEVKLLLRLGNTIGISSEVAKITSYNIEIGYYKLKQT
jgi:hypothetical protein